MDARAKEYLLRLKNDFPLYAEKLLKIRTKSGEIVKLKLNKAQRIFLEKIEEQRKELGYVRVIVLKGRQQGLSTVIAALLYHKTSTTPAQKTMVVAHKDDASRTLFDMTKRYHEGIPEVLRSKTKYSSKKELSFSSKYGDTESLDSSYLVITAGGIDPGRSETIQNAHLSEVAFWPKGSAADNFNGMMKAIPRSKGSICCIESTANGISGVFAETWRQAEAGENGFMPIFIPWYVTDEYRLPVPSNFKRTQDEQDLCKLYPLDDAQLVWRRAEIATNGLDKFRQEYPLCPEEAFLTTGSPVFDAGALKQMKDHQRRDFKVFSHMKGLGFREAERGMLHVWSEPEAGRSYTLGVDPSAGIKGRDYSVITVLDDRRRLVARFRGHVEPDYLADISYDLGIWYNSGHLIAERNNHGLIVCNRLSKELAYPNLYFEEVLDRYTQEYRKTIGFWTGEGSKALVIDELRSVVRTMTIDIPDPLTLKELGTYVVHENGTMGADYGTDTNGDALHDDTVMALALANHIFVGVRQSIRTPEAAYVEVP